MPAPVRFSPELEPLRGVPTSTEDLQVGIGLFAALIAFPYFARDEFLYCQFPVG